MNKPKQQVMEMETWAMKSQASFNSLGPNDNKRLITA